MSATPQTEPTNGLGNLSEVFRGAMVDSLPEMTTVTNPVHDMISKHFGGADPEKLPCLSDSYSTHLHLNFQMALEEFLEAPGRTYTITGIHCPSQEYETATSLALLLTTPSFAWSPPAFVPVQYNVVESGCDETKPCVLQGMILFNDEQGPGAIWIRGVLANALMLDVMHPSRERANEILQTFRERGIALSPYRGQVVEIGFDGMLAPRISFLPRPHHTEADEVILPPGLLEQIEQHSIGVVRAQGAIEASGCHMKRGLLLHGKPGTGKTHTIRYLISQLPNHTVVIMSGSRMTSPIPSLQPLNLIHDVVDVITPGVIVLDDVDFIAEDRTLPGLSEGKDALFALLELLDGMNEDADLLFVLTTNRPNTLEPAVAARPGRIDQAIAVPLPDADCRRRLLELYARDLDLQLSDDEVQTFLDRTEGVTASFVKELVRRAAVIVAQRDSGKKGRLKLSSAEIFACLDQLLDPTNPLTPVLLGAEPQHALPTMAAIAASQKIPS